ncbi:RNA polymerase subunit sigma-24 [Mangrovactinospora gilvigrisea]|uniref:RNA polymerase subunit sigma-24 n=1 Tax=Mangrovactinospora gilvigrisea TaxID=1428644 RepID=A0A1J7C4D7_9ACTN|nr:RNA polymerase subunit sigma-24 [Mangrovactinospora gilvigrisea]
MPTRSSAGGRAAVGVEERRQLINIAYRLLGSLADAEDAVQEAYTRWYALSRREREAIVSPAAWLTTVASRICLNQLTSARARREQYVGEWLPEPLPDPSEWRGAPEGDPADRITLDESVGMALLVVLDAMSPAQRVAFVLHDVFRYPFAEVARIVGRTPAACRQLASSARRRVREADAGPAGAPAQDRRDAAVVRDLKRAWQRQDIAALVSLLDPQAVAVGDGGGRASTFRHRQQGAERIARGLVRLIERFPGLALRERTVNGRPGLVGCLDGAVVTVYAFGIGRGGRVRQVWGMRNPEKLRCWPPAGAAPEDAGYAAEGADGSCSNRVEARDEARVAHEKAVAAEKAAKAAAAKATDSPAKKRREVWLGKAEAKLAERYAEHG